MRFTYCCSSRRLTLFRPFMRLLILFSGVFCFTLFIEWNHFYLQGSLSSLLLQTDFRGTPKVVQDRATCCLHPNQPEDICGRLNCTLPCTEPKTSIPELINDPKKSPFTRDNDKAFFIETSGNGALNYRQACAVESLAFHNPNLTVYVLFTDVKINSSLATLQKLVEKYTNVQLVSLNVDEYMAGTLMDHWYHCTDWRKGSYHVNNLSNALRLLTVYKYGGYYFDLDIISMHPVTYYRNFVAAESDKNVNNDVIHADLKHPFIELAMKDFVTNFRPDLWGNNGPALIFRVLKKWCNAENLKTMENVSCRGFSVLPETSFHPVRYNKVKEFFAQPMGNETEEKSISWLTEKVVGVHTWNKLSKDEPIYKNATHAYIQLAQNNCPLIFSIAPEIF